MLTALIRMIGIEPAPWPLRLTSLVPPLRGIPAWLIGVGVRPEHVHTPDVRAPAR